MDLNESASEVALDIDLNETPVCSPREVADVAPVADGKGKGKVVVLDMNALPSDNEGDDGGDFVISSGMHTACDASSLGNVLFVGNPFDRIMASDYVATDMKSSTVDSVQNKLIFDRNLTEADLRPLFLGRKWAIDHSAYTVDYQKLSEKFLQTLRQFIFDKHGILEDGWRVELISFQNSREMFPVYCAPDGNKFNSMVDVACHLGLLSNCHYVASQDRSDGFPLVQNRSDSQRRIKESLIFSRNRDFRECQENLKSSFAGEFLFGIETMDAENVKLRSNLRIEEASAEGTNRYGSSHCKDVFPIQFEDFFILSVGEVDARPSYHNSSQIWPVGYKSAWHDKITGSVFVCDVKDGGDSGPIFKVQRYPCSTNPLPVVSTILFRPISHVDKNKTHATSDMDDHEDMNVQLMLSDHSPPRLDFDFMTGSWNALDEVPISKTVDDIQRDPICVPKSLGKSVLNIGTMGDFIGEFVVEGRSSSSVWRMVSQNLLCVCNEVHKQTGACIFYCRHGVYGGTSSCSVEKSVEATDFTDPLDKFCYMCGPFDVPSHIESNDELTTCCEALSKWLEQDRFGVDMEFVQEIIEQLPGVQACSDYTFLEKRSDNSKSKTVRNGFLLAKRSSEIYGEKELGYLVKKCPKMGKQLVGSTFLKDSSPPRYSQGSKLPSNLIADVLQSWELLWRFSDVLGLDKPLSFKHLEMELVDCTFKEGASMNHVPDAVNLCSMAALTRAYCSLLTVVLVELQSKLTALIDATPDGGESKSRRRRKKDSNNLIFAKRTMLDLLPVNELTWPEIARRYIVTVSSMDGNLDSVETVNRKSSKVLHCLQGGNGALCGSLPRMAEMEANALLLAEATKRIFGSLKNPLDNIKVDLNDLDGPSTSQTANMNDGEIPEWAQVLEPVRKLPTNVGARIRKCIYEALAKNPPEWAKKILDHSISKEVYKGNASGPTKKAVLSVLSDVCGENHQQKPIKRRKSKHVGSLSDVIMKQCRKVLRIAVAADEDRVFCNLLGRTLYNTSDNDDEGLLGFPTMVSRTLDFRTIDLRLALGAYGGSHEAFLEDVREVWRHIRTAYADQSDLVQLAETLSEKFETLYEDQVLTFVHKFMEHSTAECFTSEVKKEMEDLVDRASEFVKAPWEEGVCKVCGIDKDDDSVLLCDKCDSGYHTYCLNPPLMRVPEGNWYCPSCVGGHSITHTALLVPRCTGQCRKKRHRGELMHNFLDSLAHLGETMEVKDYWECSLEQRIFLLKFLGDEMLNSANIRENLDQCASASGDLLQKLRSLYTEWRSLKLREDVLNEKLAKENSNVSFGVRYSGTGRTGIVIPNNDKLMGQLHNRRNPFPTLLNDLIHLKDGIPWHWKNEVAATEVHSQISRSTGVNVNSNNQFPIHPSYQQPDADASEFQAIKDQASLIENEIALLQDSIACLESQLLKVSLRKEFLGRDSAGRLYWAFLRPRLSTMVVVEGTTIVGHECYAEKQNGLLSDNLNCNSYPEGIESSLKLKESNIYGVHESKQMDDIPVSSELFIYQSDSEIEELIRWLRENEPMGRELLEALLRLKVGCKESNRSDNSDVCQPALQPVNGVKRLNTETPVVNALVSLGKRYSSCLEHDATSNTVKDSENAEALNESMGRCECLELIWLSRHHCCGCHTTFSSSLVLEKHNDGRCSSGDVVSKSKGNEGVLKGKGKKRTDQGEESDKTRTDNSCASGLGAGSGFDGFPNDTPFDFKEIQAKFVTKDSNKELVKEIGLLGSDGVPSFVHCGSSYIGDPTLTLAPSTEEVNQTRRRLDVENPSQKSGEADKEHMNNSNQPAKRGTADGIYEQMQIADKSYTSRKRDQLTCSKLGSARLSAIRDCSLRPLVGRGAEILRQLKMNLLDMDAALSEEALKPSKASMEKRCAWRVFVKSAKSVYEMVLATIAMEDMIKTEYFKNEWWYWSSLSAATRTATLSALALRIFTLDAAIIYDKTSDISSPEKMVEVAGKTNDSKQVSRTPSSPPAENVPSPENDVASVPRSSTRSASRTPSLRSSESSKLQTKSGKRRKVSAA